MRLGTCKIYLKPWLYGTVRLNAILLLWVYLFFFFFVVVVFFCCFGVEFSGSYFNTFFKFLIRFVYTN